MGSKAANEVFRGKLARGKVSGPVSEETITSCENELQVVFPDDYRRFLKNYGAAVLQGVELYGLPVSQGSPPLWNDVRRITQKLRSWKQLGAEDGTFIPISDDGTGVYFFLNTGVSPSTEIWAIGPGVSKIVSTALDEFVIDNIEGRIRL